MTQSRKHRGYKSQKIVAEYLTAHGFAFAESAGAGRTGSDVTGTVGIDWEVKARRGLNLNALLQQLSDRGDADLGVGVIRPDGYGEANIARWPAVLPLADLVWLLREAGYGDPNTTN